MKKHMNVGRLMLKISVKEEHKKLLIPIWRIADNNSDGYTSNPRKMGNDRFGFSFDLEAYSYNKIQTIMDNVTRFFPEAELRLEVDNF